MKTLETLITVVGLTKEQLKDYLVRQNCSGKVLIGNQCGRTGSYELSNEKCQATIFEFDDIGVSRNRNNLFERATADVITFADGDAIFPDNYLDLVYERIDLIEGNGAIRFNIESLNEKRPIKQLPYDGKFVRFNDLRSFGVCGFFIEKKHALEKKLTFNEDLGPGGRFTHGEDSSYLHDFFQRGGRCLQFRDVIYCVEQKESSWQNKDIKMDLVSHGYVLTKLYGFMSLAAIYVFGYRHRNDFPGYGYSDVIKLMKSGRKIFLQEKKAARKSGDPKARE